LGISFFTFTQIAFLVDASKGQFPSVTFSRYLLFVSFFPHLIAGPIVHFRQLSPQFAGIAEQRLGPHVAIGLTFFAIGLFKKVVLADSIARYVGPVFSRPETVTALEAWLGVLSYTMQIYFDFSGYSDMAIGLARMFGIKFPVNFASPYQATSIVDFWRRWHITLSLFLRDYLYIPLGGNRHGRTRRYLNLAVTMVLGGLWHGAAWTFVVWGALHGAYLIVNHAWIAVRTTLFPAIEDRGAYRLACRFVTFAAVVVAWTFFRADSVQSATQILQAMVGARGFALPLAWHAGAMRDQVLAVAFMIAIVMWAPNSQELVDRFRMQNQFISIGSGRLSTVAAAVVVGIGWVTAALWLYFATSTEFIYYNF
jgi:D-alanyl-lipoteichoic acid acyltransferase DltB (MBOAT superfamily)